jgi:complement component 1 Q subcomponent-binding protein
MFAFACLTILSLQFDHLDTNVQEEFERFLDERGIGGDLALFVPAYAEYKEQKVCTRMAC